MKRKLIFILVIITVLIFTTTNNILAWNPFQSSVEKAEGLINKSLDLRQMDMGEQAEAKLNEAMKILVQSLEKNTDNYDALFALAKCEYYQGNKSAAEKKFRIVYLKNKQKYGKKIFDFYRGESKRYIQISQLETSLDLAVKSYNFQPDTNRRNQAAEEMFRIGSKHLFSGVISTALLYYRATIQLNSRYQPVIARAIISAASQEKRYSPRKQLLLLHIALPFSTSLQKSEIKKGLTNIALQLKERQIKYREVKSELNKFPSAYRNFFSNIAWPATWKTVWGPKKFVCVGFTGGVDGKGRIYTIPGNVLKAGYKIIIEAESRYFEIWYSGGWKKYKIVEIINKNSSGRGHIAIRGPAGEKVITRVKKITRLNY